MITDLQTPISMKAGNKSMPVTYLPIKAGN